MTLYSTTNKEDEELQLGTAYWLKYIKERISNNQDFICAIVGKTGSGKSESGLSIMQLINGEVKEGNYFFKASDFLRKVCQLDEDNIKGEVIVWDEIGTGLSSKQWQSRLNKTMSPVFQTIRRNNLIILVTLPYFSFLDPDLRKLTHGLWETKRIDREKQQTILKPLLIQTNQDTGQMYKKFLKVRHEEKGVIKVKRIHLPRANMDSVDKYEIKAREYKQSVASSALKILLAEEMKQFQGNSENLTLEEQKAYDYWLSGLNTIQIANEMGVTFQKISFLLNKCKEKMGFRYYEGRRTIPLKGSKPNLSGISS